MVPPPLARVTVGVRQTAVKTGWLTLGMSPITMSRTNRPAHVLEESE
jgi:hypothetical protein